MRESAGPKVKGSVMKISAIICTYNRSQLLRKALISLMEQTMPTEDYEIIVADNASSDDTEEVTYSLMEKASNLRYIHEPNLGLSHARNRGISEANGEIIAFMDDDAVADSEWLKMIVRAFEDVELSPVCVGGKVKPLWETPKPDWFPEALLGYLSLLDFGDKSHWCDFPREHLVGCNIAFLKRSLLDMGGFNPLLGRKGLSLAGNEEIELLRRMKQKGEGFYYEPRAIVHHLIVKERLTKKWLLRRFYHEGVSLGVFDDDYNLSGGTHRRTRYLARNLLSAGTDTLRAIFTVNRQQKTLFVIRAACYLGKAVYLMKGKFKLLASSCYH